MHGHWAIFKGNLTMYRTVQRRPALARMLSLVVAAGFSSCAGGFEDQSSMDEGEVGSGVLEQGLAAIPNTPLWDEAGGVVTICWTNTGLSTAKTRIREAVDSSWNAYSGLTFIWPSSANSTCPRSGDIVDSEYMPIFVQDAPSFGGVCSFGFGGRQDKSVCGGVMQCQCVINTASDSTEVAREVEYATIHEVGHGLGMIHEHQRVDRPSNIASTCTDPNPDPTKWTTNGNYTIINPAVLATKYDASSSMMSYCYDPDNDGVQGELRVNPGGGYPMLGPLDRLGMEMFYPFSFSRLPVASSGIGNAAGTEYVVRSDVATPLLTDWSDRGALSSFLKNSSPPASIRWKDATTNVVFSTSVSPSLTLSSTKVVAVEVDDALGRHHSWTSATMIPDNARFSGVVSSSSNYLLL
jgi:hypothetical protein